MRKRRDYSGIQMFDVYLHDIMKHEKLSNINKIQIIQEDTVSSDLETLCQPCTRTGSRLIMFSAFSNSLSLGRIFYSNIIVS